MQNNHFLSRFISAPIVIMIATFVVPKYMREKVINGVELGIAFQAHLIFFVSTCSLQTNFFNSSLSTVSDTTIESEQKLSISRKVCSTEEIESELFVSNQVRTTQIAIMDKMGKVESGSLEHFSNYKYAPSKPANAISIFALSATPVGGTFMGQRSIVVGSNYNHAIMPASVGNGQPPTTTNSVESEVTSTTSLSNNSAGGARSTPQQLPEAEE